MLLNGITLGQAINDPIKRIRTTTKNTSYRGSMLLKDNWYLINLGQFDPINEKITLTMIPLSSANFITSLTTIWAFVISLIER
jgi:hypothetical protein